MSFNTMSDRVNHPAHYGGADNPYEAIKVIEHWRLNFCCGNAFKYLSRAGRKASLTDPRTKFIEDIDKAIWYLERQYTGLQTHNPAAWVTPITQVSPLYEVDAVMQGLQLDPRFIDAISACRWLVDMPRLTFGISSLRSLRNSV